MSVLRLDESMTKAEFGIAEERRRRWRLPSEKVERWMGVAVSLA